MVLAAILSSTVDITVVMTPDGVICDQVLTSPEISKSLFTGWPGKALRETVTVESKPKVEQLLQEANAGLKPRWRQVNHPVTDGRDLPVNYSVLRAGPAGHLIALGRDMSATAVLQQRLIAAEQSVEQEYQQLRQAETRFRVLLQNSSDGIIIVDARNGRVVECNPVATAVVGRSEKRLKGSALDDLFEGTDSAAVGRAIDALRTAGRADDVVLQPKEGRIQAVVSFSMFRQGNSAFHLLRLVPHTVDASAVVLPKAQSRVLKIISEMPDGFVVTDKEQRVLAANSAFLSLAQLGNEQQARGNALEMWLGRAGVDFGMIAKHLDDAGEIRGFQTIIRGQYGAIEDVEVSGVAVREGDTPYHGFTLHPVSRHKAAGGKVEKTLLRSVDDFTRLVGKVPLKDLVRESTDIIERLCIEAALQLNDDNRASAAEMLGLSRQSLYVKLHRYGIDAINEA
jgi:transcriptional regulator PpsR